MRFGVLLYGIVLCLGMIWTVHNERSAIERDDHSDVRSLHKLPKAGYASKVAIAALPSGGGRKAIYSHVYLYKVEENIANVLLEQGVRPDAVCTIGLLNCVEMTA